MALLNLLEENKLEELIQKFPCCVNFLSLLLIFPLPRRLSLIFFVSLSPFLSCVSPLLSLYLFSSLLRSKSYFLLLSHISLLQVFFFSPYLFHSLQFPFVSPFFLCPSFRSLLSAIYFIFLRSVIYFLSPFSPFPPFLRPFHPSLPLVTHPGSDRPCLYRVSPSSSTRKFPGGRGRSSCHQLLQLVAASTAGGNMWQC